MGGAGSDASAYAGGTMLTITIKSGGDRFSGNWYSDYLKRGHDQRDQRAGLPQTANTPTRTAIYIAHAAHPRQPDRPEQYDINFNIGGPIWKQKAWFFYSYRLNDQYTYILGLDDQVAALEADQPLHVQGHLPARIGTTS